MNTLNKLFCTSLFGFALLLASCGTTDNRLFAVKRNELYGFVNAKAIQLSTVSTTYAILTP